MVPKILTEAADFRTYEPEWVHGKDGMVQIRLCEQRDPDSGYWDPFIITLAKAPGETFWRGVEAQKHFDEAQRLP